jgi:hypothetical protein
MNLAPEYKKEAEISGAYIGSVEHISSRNEQMMTDNGRRK